MFLSRVNLQALLTRLEFSKFLRHGGVAARQFLDGHVLSLVIGQPQIPVGTQQGFLGI